MRSSARDMFVGELLDVARKAGVIGASWSRRAMLSMAFGDECWIREVRA